MDRAYHPFLQFFLLLFNKLRRNTFGRLLSVQHHLPQLGHELSGSFGVQKSGQIDLHHSWIQILKRKNQIKTTFHDDQTSARNNRKSKMNRDDTLMKQE